LTTEASCIAKIGRNSTYKNRNGSMEDRTEIKNGQKFNMQDHAEHHTK
jgi:hypothetical protein